MADIVFDYDAARSIKKELTTAHELALKAMGDIQLCATNLETAWSNETSQMVVDHLRSYVDAYRQLASGMQDTIKRLDETAARLKAVELAEASKVRQEETKRQAEAAEQVRKQQQEAAEYARRQQELRERYPDLDSLPSVH